MAAVRVYSQFNARTLTGAWIETQATVTSVPVVPGRTLTGA